MSNSNNGTSSSEQSSAISSALKSELLGQEVHLKSVDTEVKQVLPSPADIAQEKLIQELDTSSSGDNDGQAVSGDGDSDTTSALRQRLKSVDTVEKQVLPTQQDIAAEKAAQ